jgi:hypothetical protein
MDGHMFAVKSESPMMSAPPPLWKKNLCREEQPMELQHKKTGSRWTPLRSPVVPSPAAACKCHSVWLLSTLYVAPSRQRQRDAKDT